MGLDTTHNAWHGAYSKFNRFRVTIAATIGIDLMQMEGFKGTGSWDKWKTHDLYPLLSHSDCDGELSVSECERTAKGLIDILGTYDNTVESDSDFIDNVIQFIGGCLLAIANNEPISFG